MHPFHPWHGRSYEFVVRRNNWGRGPRLLPRRGGRGGVRANDVD
ncbi:hypothetical protein ACWDG1_33495 [Streptomyces sp. NPDC001177]